jgi:hypothetical protein
VVALLPTELQDANVIPDGKSKWGRFYELRDMVDNALKSKAQ